MRRLVAVAALVLLVLALALGGAAAWLMTEDFRPRVEAAVQRATGHVLTIGGPLRLGWNLSIDATGLTLANAPGEPPPAMVQIDRAHAQLALVPLLRGELAVTDLRLVNPQIVVARGVDGVWNWQFRRRSSPQSSADASPERSAWRLRWRVDHLTSEGGTLAWRDARQAVPDGRQPLPAIQATFDESGATPHLATPPPNTLVWRSGQPTNPGAGRTIVAAIAWRGPDFAVDATATASQQWPPLAYGMNADIVAHLGDGRDARIKLLLTDAQLRGNMVGSFRALPLRASATLGPEALRDVAAPLRVSAALADDTADFSGTLAPHAAGLDGTLAARANDLGPLGAILGLSVPPGIWSLDSHLMANATGVALAGMRLQSPAGDFGGDLRWTPGARPKLVGSLSAQRMDLAAVRAVLAEPPGSPPARTVAATTAPPPPPTPAHVISDRILPFAALGRIDADLRLRAATLTHPDLHELDAHILLRDGALTLDPFTAQPGGAVAGSLRIDSRPAPPTIALTLHAPNLDVAPLLALLGLPPAATGEATMAADLRAAGRTPHELAASISGSASLASGGADVDGSLLASLMVAAHLPAIGAGSVRLRCVVVGIAATAGRVTLAPLLLDSNRLLLQGGGGVDLNTETLAMQLRPSLRSGFGITVPLRVTGPWRSPKVSPDPDGLLAARDPDPCPAALAQVHGPAVAPPPPLAVHPGGKIKAPKPIDILRDLLK